ncbi:chloride channel protein [Aureimonas ureilytica]|uniref:chloride channel protein n=1 Tax=Aureimonas ureilytica TaxID=401562 RepID=UPI003CF02970
MSSLSAPARRRRLRTLRRSRAVWMSRKVWRPRLVFWAGAVAIGLVSVLFAEAADGAQHLFAAVAGQGGALGTMLRLLVPPLGFALSAWLALRFFPYTQGSGIPQAIAARHLEDDGERRLLLSLKGAAGKILLTVVGLLSGASIGREGPTVQVGAAIMLASGRIGGMAHARGLILAGSAAGIAAAFNTPLAGIVFAIEEMGRSYEARTNGLVLSAVVLAGLASLALTGNYTYFGETSGTVATLKDWGLVLACGVLGGALGALFSKLVLALMRRFRLWTRGRAGRLVALAAACGLGVALIGLLSGGTSYGTGYETARAAVEGQAGDPAFFLWKFAASLLSTVSGVPGGIFAPSLSVGAGLGATFGLVFGANIGLAATLGMAGYFAGVVQAPMTAFVIILEMTAAREHVMPLLVAAMIGFGTARLISGEPLYHTLSRNFIADILRLSRAAEQPQTKRGDDRRE